MQTIDAFEVKTKTQVENKNQQEKKNEIDIYVGEIFARKLLTGYSCGKICNRFADV